jgi:glycosyltransferase involved in cell wall biosynthesis
LTKDNSKVIRVAYLYAGERAKAFSAWQKGEMPDSFFIGLNHLKCFGIDADFIESKLSNRLRKVNYNLAHINHIIRLRKYDVVFAGCSLFVAFVIKRLFRWRSPKLVWYNTFFTQALKRSTGIKKRILISAISSLDAVVCPSTYQRDYLIDQGFDPKKIYFVPNGVDVDFIRDKQSELRNNSNNPFILSVGKDMGRDYDTLIGAVKGLPIRVRIVAFDRNIEHLKPLPDNVEAGPVPFSELIKMYKESEFVVLPTKSENHPDASDCSGQYVLLDCLASGKPIIASQRKTLADYIENGREALIINVGDINGLQNAILKLIDDKELREQMSQNSYKRGTRLTTSKLAEELSKIFRKLVAS